MRKLLKARGWPPTGLVTACSPASSLGPQQSPASPWRGGVNVSTTRLTGHSWDGWHPHLRRSSASSLGRHLALPTAHRGPPGPRPMFCAVLSGPRPLFSAVLSSPVCRSARSLQVLVCCSTRSCQALVSCSTRSRLALVRCSTRFSRSPSTALSAISGPPPAIFCVRHSMRLSDAGPGFGAISSSPRPLPVVFRPLRPFQQDRRASSGQHPCSTALVRWGHPTTTKKKKTTQNPTSFRPSPTACLLSPPALPLE